MTDKDLKYYYSLNYPMIVKWDADDNVYLVEFPDLPGCMAHGKTTLSAINLAQKVKKVWIEDALSSGIVIREPKTEEDYSGRFVVRIPPTLHKRLSEQAAREGRSLNSHVATLLSERSAAITVERVVVKVENTLALAVEKAITKIERAASCAVITVGQPVAGTGMGNTLTQNMFNPFEQKNKLTTYEYIHKRGDL